MLHSVRLYCNVILLIILMNNSKKLIRSALFGQLPIIVQLISGFVIMPKLIAYFGDADYGLWVLVGAFLGYFGLLDFGFSKTIVRYVSRALGQHDKKASDGWITMGVFWFSLSALLGFFALGGMVWGCRYFVTDNVQQIQHVLMLGGGAFLVVFPSRCAIGVLQAHVRGDVLDGVLSGVGLLRITLLFAALYVQAPFIVFVGILAVSTVMEGFLLICFALRIHGSFQVQWQWVTRTHIKQFLEYSGFAFIAQLADLFRFQAYPLIISAFLGLAAITPFAIANRLRLMLGQIHNKVLVNLTSVFSQIEGRDGVGEKLCHAYLFAYKISCYFVSFTCGMMVIIAPCFILRWMGPAHEQSVTLLLVAMIAALAAGIQIPAICFLFGTSRHRFYSISNSIEAILIIVSALLLVRSYGLLGMVAGASASTFAVKMFLQPFWVARILNFSLWSLHIKHTLPHLLRVTLFLFGTYGCAQVVLKPTYWNLGLFSVAACTLFVPYIWFVGFTHSEHMKLLTSMPGTGQLQTICSLAKHWRTFGKRGED